MSMTLEVPWGYLKVCRGSTVLEARGVGLLCWMKRWEQLAMVLLHVFKGFLGLASSPLRFLLTFLLFSQKSCACYSPSTGLYSFGDCALTCQVRVTSGKSELIKTSGVGELCEIEDTVMGLSMYNFCYALHGSDSFLSDDLRICRFTVIPGAVVEDMDCGNHVL